MILYLRIRIAHSDPNFFSIWQAPGITVERAATQTLRSLRAMAAVIALPERERNLNGAVSRVGEM
jgi:hypothetical protein